MRSYKGKIIIALFISLFGFLIAFAGFLFKIQHWPYANEISVIGSFILIAGIILLFMMLINRYKHKT